MTSRQGNVRFCYGQGSSREGRGLRLPIRAALKRRRSRAQGPGHVVADPGSAKLRKRHHPGITSLRLSPSAAAGWKQRIKCKTLRGAAGEASTPRAAAAGALFTVRAFYLDIAQWAIDDPA